MQIILLLALHSGYKAVGVHEEFCEVLQQVLEFLPLLYKAINLSLPLLSHLDDTLPLFLQQSEFGDELSSEIVGRPMSQSSTAHFHHLGNVADGRSQGLHELECERF